MIYGVYPFTARTQEQAIKNIISSTAKWDPSTKVSSEWKDLISKLLVKDPSSRIDIFSVLSHPWFLMSDEDINISKKSKDNSFLKISFTNHDKDYFDPAKFGILSKANTKRLKDLIIEK